MFTAPQREEGQPLVLEDDGMSAAPPPPPGWLAGMSFNVHSLCLPDFTAAAKKAKKKTARSKGPIAEVEQVPEVLFFAPPSEDPFAAGISPDLPSDYPRVLMWTFCALVTSHLIGWFTTSPIPDTVLEETPMVLDISFNSAPVTPFAGLEGSWLGSPLPGVWGHGGSRFHRWATTIVPPCRHAYDSLGVRGRG